MAPRTKTETISDDDYYAFQKVLEDQGEGVLGLLLNVMRAELAMKEKEVSESTAAFEVLSQIYEADACGKVTLNDWNKTARKLSLSYPSVRVPLWAFSVLARGWSRYVEHKGKKLDEAMKLRLRSGQGEKSPGDVINRKIRDLALTARVVDLRILRAREGQPISEEAACEFVAQEAGKSIGVVKEAYQSERKNYKMIAQGLGFNFAAPYGG